MSEIIFAKLAHYALVGFGFIALLSAMLAAFLFVCAAWSNSDGVPLWVRIVGWGISFLAACLLFGFLMTVEAPRS